MLISVVVPSFNQADYLDQTLRSLFAQDHRGVEVMVLDGGSTDGSVDIIRRHEARLAYWSSGPDGGQAQAIANGFGRARGELIGWLNSDDVLLPGALARIAATARRVGTCDAVFHGGYRVIDQGGAVMELAPAFEEPAWCRAVLGPVVCQPGAFFGREAYFRVGGLDTTLHYGMDQDLWLRFDRAGIPFRRVPGYLASFRRHSLQKGHNLEWQRRAESEGALLRRRYGLAEPGSGPYGRARALRRLVGLASGARLVTLAYRLARRGTLREFHPDYS
jgi:glycosyltransferase involved in cell wall biosynthesis